MEVLDPAVKQVVIGVCWTSTGSAGGATDAVFPPKNIACANNAVPLTNKSKNLHILIEVLIEIQEAFTGRYSVSER
jgi:hypothetical protein